MKKLNLLLIFTVLLLISNACKKKKEEEANKIHQTYNLSYDENTDKTWVSASFSNDYYWDKPHYLYMNGEAMECDSNSNIYSYSINGIINTAVITFKNHLGKEYTNTITLCSPIANCDTNYIDNGASSKFYWVGNPISYDEQVSMSFQNADAGPFSKHFSFSNITYGASYIALSASSLSSLAEGTANIKIRRYRTIYTGDFADGGGLIRSTYEGKDSQLEIH